MPRRVRDEACAVGELRQDHMSLRQSLMLVEGSLRVGAPAWPILEEACVHIATQLEQHIAREEPFRIRSVRRIGKAAAEGEVPHHKEQARQLRRLVMHLVVTKDLLPKDVDSALYLLIEELERQMEDQEERWIPSAGLFQAGMLGTPRFASGLHGTTTVNRLTHLYPATRRVFEQMGVDPHVEGCVEVEELAWYRGLESRALLERLDGAIRSAGHATVKT